jgi:hypothetical protein
MILYQPGQRAGRGAAVPRVYQVQKSLGHSGMAISEVVMPYLDNAADKTWVAPMRAYLSEMKSALEGIEQADMPADWKPNSKSILENNVAFMEDCLAKGVITFDVLQVYAKKQVPHLKARHQLGRLDPGQALDGRDGQVEGRARPRLRQGLRRRQHDLRGAPEQRAVQRAGAVFGAEAINDRLMLIETISFTTTPEDMLTSMVRIISDRSVGGLFFNSYHLMDYELMGGDARKTIIAEMKKRGKEPVLPPAVPFGSRQWPALISGGSGPASLDDIK